MKSLAPEQSADAALGVLSHFRVQFYDCLYSRADALFELTDAVLCADGPVTSLVELTLTAEHRRGHGAMYDAVNHGWLEPRRLRRLLASTPLPRAADGRIVLAVDVSNWLRPDAPTSPELLFCHVYGRGRSADQFIPGWPYSFVAALETGRTSWTAVLDAVRLGPADDATAVTAAQIREVFGRLLRAGQWRPGDADILIVMDSGYDVTRLAYVLTDLPVELVGRLRSDRVMLRDAGPRRSTPRGGQPRKHGGVLTFAKPDSWHTPDQATTCDTTRYGRVPAVQADPGLDRAEGPRPRDRRPVDLADHRRPHSTPPRPTARRGPPPPLGTTRRAPSAHPGPGPPGVPAPPREDPPSRGCSETLPARPRTSNRLTKPQASPTPRAREDRETSRDPHRTCPPETAARLKIKLRNCISIDHEGDLIEQDVWPGDLGRWLVPGRP